MNIILSADLEFLSEKLFNSWDEHPSADPLKSECLIVQNRLTESWLRHQFLFEQRRPTRQRVRANWDVHYLHAFVNDWLHRMNSTECNAPNRDPETHPFSKSSLQWRLYCLLGSELRNDPRFQRLSAYLKEHAPAYRRFGLAATLAKLFDSYQIHRPQMLLNWEQKKSILTSETEEWQALLWCTLVEKNSASYLKSFVSMEEQLPKCNLPEHVERISIFGVSNMPPIYLKFFSIVSKRVPVTLYILEPSPNAVATLTRSSRSSRAEELPLEGEIEAHSTSKNSLVSSLSHVHRTFIEEATRRACADHVYERIEIPTKESCTLLQSVQSDIRNDRPLGLQDVAPSNDDSIRIHICHSPMRELEVLRDHMLLWFTDPTLQPRHIQVMVCDMKTYAPYIEAVFGKVNPKDPHSIPYALADRLVLETSDVAKAFVSILALPTSRFKASEVIDLLACEALRTRFNFSTEDIASIRNLVSNTGIRWGLDVAHRKELSDVEFTDATCWRQGLDRLLMGYAMGNSNDVATKIPNFNGARTAIVPEASVSENDTEILGKLIGFMDRLNWARKKVSGLQDGKKPKKNLSEWSRHLLEIFEAFFLNTNETFADLNPIRDELLSLGKKSQISDLANEAVEFDAVVAYLNGRIKNSEKADALLANKVVFCGMSLCATMPHRMVCVLGLGDGIFPRGDARPAFDLLSRDPVRRNGYPSQRLSDRGAFLEVLLAAQQKLHLSYVGRGVKDNTVIPPSTIINDLKSYLETRFKLPPPKKTWDEKTDLSSFETLHHLQPFHADYFKKNNDGLFSCSEENLNGALALLKSKSNLQARTSKPHAMSQKNTTDSDWSITLEELCKFLENPAKTYFTETLKVRFNENKETLLIDDEMFEATSLDAYTLNQTILERMLLNQTPLHTPPPLFSQELMQRALLPLGDSGVITLGDKWDELHDFLNSKLPDYEGNLRALLLEKKEKQPISIDFGDCMKLTGHVEVFLIGTQKIYLAMRYSTLKAKDQLRAWIRHLALSAQELCVKTILVSTDKDKNLTTKTFPTLTKPESLKILQPLLQLFKQGKSKPLPFALETSLEYCKQLQKNPEAIEKALNSALKKWRDNEHSPGDSKDPYLYRAFGENSPTAVEEFHVCARQVFEVLLKIEASPKNETVPNDLRTNGESS